MRKNEEFYDERQILARGNAFKVGFFTMAAYIGFVGILSEFMNVVLSFGLLWIGVCLSIGVLIIICIVKNAYVSLQDNAKGVMMMFGIFGFLNLIIGLPDSTKDLVETVWMVEDGETFECVRLSTEIVNLSVGILFIIVLAVLAGKLWYDKRHEEEDAEA
ncbi:MAG: hypothetical protein NC347_11545 [Clostridium sp.]|nr:hypothetical protein [Clostridium sp.]